MVDNAEDSKGKRIDLSAHLSQKRHTRHPATCKRTDATSWVVTNGHTSHLSGGHPKPAQATQGGL